MDRRTWQDVVHGVARVGHNLATNHQRWPGEHQHEILYSQTWAKLYVQIFFLNNLFH